MNLLQSFVESIGAVSRDIVEAADSTYEFTKEVVTDTASDIANIPEYLAQGYSEGAISDGDFPKEPTPPTTPEVAAEAPKGAEVSNAKAGEFPGQ